MTALHRLLGKPAGVIDEALLDEAVAAGLAETDDLDWKRALPPTSGLSESDFPKDVAAMANSGGGTLIYGVEETDKKATRRVQVGDLTERHEQSLRSAAITAVSPPLFGLEIVRMGAGDDRAVAIIVPASTNGPHVIYRGEYFGAPIRNDASTVWMKEPQIAAAYRARLEDSRRAGDALHELWEEVSANLPSAQRARIILAGRPRSTVSRHVKPDPRVISGYVSRGWSIGQWLTNNRAMRGQHPLESVNMYNLRPGLRRWMAMNSSVAEDEFGHAAQAAVHDDGSVTVAATVGGQHHSDDAFQPHEIEARDIECAVADFMGLMLAVSEEVPVREYEVQVGVEWTGAPLVIWSFDDRGRLSTAFSTPLGRYLPVIRTVTMDCSDEEFIQQVHDVAQDCINQGGILRVGTIYPDMPWRKDRGVAG